MPDDRKNAEDGCKIDKTIRELELPELNERLVSRWRGDGSDRLGVRKLADYYNRQVLREVLRRADDIVRGDQAEYVYQLFSADPTTDDTEVTVSQQEEWRSTLSDAGVDIDSVEKEHWVSYTTIYAHLTQCLDETAPDTSSSRTLTDDMDVVRRLATKSEKIAGAQVERQVDVEGDVYGRFEFDGSVRIRCDRCGYKDTFVRFLSDGGCYCDDVSVAGDADDTDIMPSTDEETEGDSKNAGDVGSDSRLPSGSTGGATGMPIKDPKL